MKKVKLTNRWMHTALLSFGVMALAACGGGAEEDPAKVAEEINEENFDDRKNEKDADFLVEAATINMEEIKLGELAQQKGSMAEVKALGKMMEEEHSKSFESLKTLAENKMVTLPSSLPEDVMDAYNKLNEKSGKEFDEAYCDMMVKGHKRAIDKFEKAANDANDADIRNWASSAIPSLQMHLDESKKCEELCKAKKK